MRLAYPGVFALALAVRLAIVAWTADTPLARSPALDSRQYLVWAQWILDGRFTWPQPTAQGPAYPLLLAALLALTSGSLKLVAAIQGAIGALSAVVTMAIAARVLDRRAAIAAGVLQAVYAPLALAETSLLRSAMTWRNLGVLHYNLSRLDQAREAHRQALAIDPGYADAWMRLALVEGRERRYDLAATHMRKAAGIYPRDVPIRRYSRAISLRGGGLRRRNSGARMGHPRNATGRRSRILAAHGTPPSFILSLSS